MCDTMEKNYAVKNKKMANISNCLQIKNADLYNDTRNFKKKYTDKPHISGERRLKLAHKKLFLQRMLKTILI